MTGTCEINYRKTQQILLEDAEDLVYLECLEDRDMFQVGDIIFKENTQIFTLRTLDGYDDLAFDEYDFTDLPVYVLQPGDSFTITIEEND